VVWSTSVVLIELLSNC